MQTKQLGLYLLVFVLAGITVLVALGGGLFSQSAPWYMQWQHKAFLQLCHQMPERSFWMGGQPMAVCSRCLGIYTAFLGGWLLLPAWSSWSVTAKISTKKMALFALLINIFDIVGSMFGFWENTLVSRFIIGGLMGCSAALIFSGDFFNITINSMGNHHGRIKTADS